MLMEAMANMISGKKNIIVICGGYLDRTAYLPFTGLDMGFYASIDQQSTTLTSPHRTPRSGETGLQLGLLLEKPAKVLAVLQPIRQKVAHRRAHANPQRSDRSSANREVFWTHCDDHRPSKTASFRLIIRT